MSRQLNFKKMYLISSQKWSELSTKKKLEENSKNKVNDSIDNGNEKSDGMVNRSNADDESEHGSKITSKDLTNDFDSTTNIRVDQSEKTKVKNISIGIKNDCNLSNDKTMQASDNNRNGARKNDKTDMKDFVSCDCTKLCNWNDIQSKVNYCETDKSNRPRSLISDNNQSAMEPQQNTERTEGSKNKKISNLTDKCRRKKVLVKPSKYDKRIKPSSHQQKEISGDILKKIVVGGRKRKNSISDTNLPQAKRKRSDVIEISSKQKNKRSLPMSFIEDGVPNKINKRKKLDFNVNDFQWIHL